MMARRAAIVDAYRQLAEYVGGVNIDSQHLQSQLLGLIDLTINTHLHGGQVVEGIFK